MQPNRLERVWKNLKPEILSHWSQLREEELESCEYAYDCIVEMIRKRYYPGRSHLTFEAEIRDWLTERIGTYERTSQS